MSLGRRLRQPSLIFGVACLLLLCAASVHALSFIDSLTGSAYHRSQTIWIVLGLIGAGVVAAMDIGFVRRVSPTVYQILLALLIAVLVFGREINHSRRWIELGPMNLQPSEFMKLAVVLVLADWFERRRHAKAWALRRLFVPMMFLLVPVVLINRQPDLGTSICVALIAASVILYEGVRGQTIIGAVLLVVLAIPLAWRFGAVESYQKARVQAWVALDENAARKNRTARASQAEQALWAVGSGRTWGRTHDQASHSVLRHLPFLHTDFVLAAWSELYGLVGTLALFGLYAGVLFWALHLADTSRDRFDALLAVGVASLIFWQFFINSGMVIGMLPVVGMTLPILSYGGSSMLTVLLSVGFLLNIALRRRNL